MRKQILCGLLLCFMTLAAGCSSPQTLEEQSQSGIVQAEFTWTNDPLTSEQIKLDYSYYTKPDSKSAESVISKAGEEWFAQSQKEIYEMIEAMGDDVREDDRSLAKIWIDDIRVYPAGDGLFALYGFRLGGALDPTWYDIHFINSDYDEIIYSGHHYIGDIHTVGNGEKLFLLWSDGELSSMDKAGKTEQFCKVTPPNDDAEIYGMLSKLSGSGSEITAEVAFVNENEDGSRTGTREKVVFDLTAGSISSQEQSELEIL